MGEHRAERLPIECPICRRDVGGGLRDHLAADHTREELAEQVVAYHDAIERGTLA